jgi:hypothetical protein
MADNVDKMDVDSKEQALRDHFEETLGQRDGSESSETKKPEDLSGDGGVLKELIKEGDGWEKPAKGSDVSGAFHVCRCPFPHNCSMNQRIENVFVSKYFRKTQVRRSAYFSIFS